MFSESAINVITDLNSPVADKIPENQCLKVTPAQKSAGIEVLLTYLSFIDSVGIQSNADHIAGKQIASLFKMKLKIRF